ncbi:hypothetical protein [Cryptosporangium arvum]|uniref:hypothetical protein n=1 Tax=Cryptosporangium arvum TaxID=80871 RepID=UPI0004BB7C65|nr:hypothetical protein [Cryptosporangium arvum]
MFGDPVQTFQVNAEAILAQQFDPRRYPHRHLVIVGSGLRWVEQLARVMAAVEMLTTVGFELVTVGENEQSHIRYAVLRRSAPAA